MDEYERQLRDLEADLNVQRFDLLLPRLLELAEGNISESTRIYCVGARSYYVSGDRQKCEEMLNLAREIARGGPLEAVVRVSLSEASILNSGYHAKESEEKLGLALSHLSEIPISMRATALAVHGRNEAILGAYAEAIEHSQEAIELGQDPGSSAPFAYGTIAYVFNALGRFEDAEEYCIRQIEKLVARGSKQIISALYLFLEAGAAEQQKWEKAVGYHEKAIAAMGDMPETSAMRISLLFWMAELEIGLKNFSKAIEYAEEALLLAEKIDNIVYFKTAKVQLGWTYFKDQQYSPALNMFLEALAVNASLSDIDQVQLYRGLTKTYEALGQKAEAFDYCIKLLELQHDFDNRTREAILVYNKGLEQKVHKQKTDILEIKATHLERELSLQAISMAAQTDMLAHFRDDLRRVVREIGEPLQALSKVKEKLKELPCEQIDWTKFEAQFTEAHPEFGSKLNEKFPDLSPAEVRLCKLLRLDLKSSEIARLFCLSERTIETQRFAVRKKLGLKREESIADALAKL
jgi:tetratricopeptide (TPR) repeat protein